MNIEEHLCTPDDMPCCPICDNQILQWDEAIVVTAYGCKSLAHLMCVEDSDEDDESWPVAPGE